MTLVIDANVTVRARGTADGFAEFSDYKLVAPPLLWSEFFSVIHEALWRDEVSDEHALQMLGDFDAAPIECEAPSDLRRTAWRLADEFGWAKTYDAEYVALAQILDCRLVTVDGRLRRGADRLGFVVTPEELRREREQQLTSEDE